MMKNRKKLSEGHLIEYAIRLGYKRQLVLTAVRSLGGNMTTDALLRAVIDLTNKERMSQNGGSGH